MSVLSLRSRNLLLRLLDAQDERLREAHIQARKVECRNCRRAQIHAIADGYDDLRQLRSELLSWRSA